MSLFDHYDVHGLPVACDTVETEIWRLRKEVQRLGGKSLVQDKNAEFWFGVAVNTSAQAGIPIADAMDPIAGRDAEIAKLHAEIARWRKPTCRRCNDDELAVQICRHVAEGEGIEVFTDPGTKLDVKHCGDRTCPTVPICRRCWDNLYSDVAVDVWWPDVPTTA